MTSLTVRASSYVTTVGEALRTCLDLSTPLCQRGEGADNRLLPAFAGWASNPEESADLILLYYRAQGSGDTVGYRVDGGELYR